MIDAAGRRLSLPQLHALLLGIAEEVGSRPRYVRGPGTELIWRIGDRGLRVCPGRIGRGAQDYHVTSGDFDWETVDDENYKAFKYAMSLVEVPYLWELPIAGGAQWWPGGWITTTWEEFFECFDSCMNQMPSALRLLPPDWRGREPAVTTLWNLVSNELITVSVDISARGVDLAGMRLDQSEFTIHIPADRLGRRDVNLPAVMAGLTATGNLRELEFFECERDPDGVHPVGIGRDDRRSPADEMDPADVPPAIQSLDEVRRLLAGQPPTQSATRAPEKAPSTMEPTESRKRAFWRWRRGGR